MIKKMKIGVLSDTHDLLRPEVIEALRGCDVILHGGDISSRKILDQLALIAPVRAVRGNNDGEWAENLPLTLDFELGGLRVFMAHKKKDLPKDLAPYDLVVYGHSHQYAAARQQTSPSKETLLLNPGSCGPRRFLQPVTLAVVSTDGGGLTVTRVDVVRPDREPAPPAGGDVRGQIEIVVRETRRGQTVGAIAARHGIPPALVEQIARLYVTHPGVTVDGIMAKMGL